MRTFPYKKFSPVMIMYCLFIEKTRNKRTRKKKTEKNKSNINTKRNRMKKKQLIPVAIETHPSKVAEIKIVKSVLCR